VSRLYRRFIISTLCIVISGLMMIQPIVAYAQSVVIADHLATQEMLTRWLSDQTVKSLLLSIIFLAVFTEIKTAGMGVAGFIGLVAAVLFFASQWLVGMAEWLELILFMSGILLLLIELYVPGFGFWGISGMSCMLASFFLTLGGNMPAIHLLSISLVIAIIAFLGIVKFLPSSTLWSKVMLIENTPAGLSSGLDYSLYLGKEGVVICLLRPAGVIEIDGVHIDVVSEGQYIEPGVIVKVVSVNGSRIVVQRV